MKALNLAIVLVVLILAFIVITSIKPAPKEDTTKQTQPVQYKVLSCLEKCGDTQVCRDKCNTIIINQAVFATDLRKCNEIIDKNTKTLCEDKVTFSIAVSNKDKVECDNIANIDLRNSCNNLIK